MRSHLIVTTYIYIDYTVIKYIVKLFKIFTLNRVFDILCQTSNSFSYGYGVP